MYNYYHWLLFKKSQFIKLRAIWVTDWKINNLLRRRISNNLDFPVYVRADAYNRYAALSQGGPRDALYISKSKK